MLYVDDEFTQSKRFGLGNPKKCFFQSCLVFHRSSKTPSHGTLSCVTAALLHIQRFLEQRIHKTAGIHSVTACACFVKVRANDWQVSVLSVPASHFLMDLKWWVCHRNGSKPDVFHSCYPQQRLKAINHSESGSRRADPSPWFIVIISASAHKRELFLKNRAKQALEQEENYHGKIW